MGVAGDKDAGWPETAVSIQDRHKGLPRVLVGHLHPSRRHSLTRPQRGPKVRKSKPDKARDKIVFDTEPL